MNDMSATIIPKSDQLNSDDLISGPITIKVTGVTIKTGEQPVSIFYEGDNGKPYKCCKSMARILVSAWGADSKKYVGRSMTLYRDPAVKWAGMEVGGIRISHMSHIADDMTMALTVTRSNRKPFTVRPLDAATVNAPAQSAPVTTAAPPSATTASAGASYLSPDQLLDIEDKCKVAKLDVAKLLDAASAAGGSKIPSLAKMPAAFYQRALGWIERGGK